MKVTVANLKGGTGKTVSAFFLAAALTRYGKTLLVDCDPQGSTLSWAEGAEENGAHLTFSVMGLPVKDVHRKLKGFENDYEHIVLDTPPGEIAITRSALLAADTALLPVPPTAIPPLGACRVTARCEKMGMVIRRSIYGGHPPEDKEAAYSEAHTALWSCGSGAYGGGHDGGGPAGDSDPGRHLCGRSGLMPD